VRLTSVARLEPFDSAQDRLGPSSAESIFFVEGTPATNSGRVGSNLEETYGSGAALHGVYQTVRLEGRGPSTYIEFHGIRAIT
jgi:hypothetical protein